MTSKKMSSWTISRRSVLKGSAGLAFGATILSTVGAPATRAAGGKVIIGAFADGGLTPFKDKIIPLAKSEAGLRS